MAMSEIDSFIVKFKHLLFSGRNASLTMNSSAGKAEVNLYVQLCDVHVPHDDRQPDTPHRSRNGPSRQRRRQRRAAAQQESSRTEEVREVLENVVEDAPNENDSTESDPETFKDEFCSDNTFEGSATIELVEKLLVIPEHENDLEDSCIKDKIEKDLDSLGIQVINIDAIDRSSRGNLASCCVCIVPTEKKKIEEASFPLRVRGWTLNIS